MSDASNHAQERAVRLQDDLDLIMEVEDDEEQVMARLQSVADGLHELADLWEANNNPKMAERVRKEEERTRALMARLSELAGLTASEAQKVLDEIKRSLAEGASGS